MPKKTEEEKAHDKLVEETRKQIRDELQGKKNGKTYIMLRL